MTVTWTASSAPSDTWKMGCAGGADGKTVLAYADGNRLLRSTDGGKTWARVTLPVSRRWNAIEWNGSVFCMVGGDPTGSVYGYGFFWNKCLTSPDGITWTERPMGLTAVWVSLVWNGSVFVAVGEGPEINMVARSPDGITWTQCALPTDGYYPWEAAAVLGTQLAVSSYDSHVATSDNNGVTWTLHTLPQSGAWEIRSNGSVYLIYDLYGVPTAFTSADGASWTQHNLPSASGYVLPLLDRAGLMAYTPEGTTSTAYTTLDGVLWEVSTLPSAGDWYPIAGTADGVIFIRQNSAVNNVAFAPFAMSGGGGGAPVSFWTGFKLSKEVIQ